MRDEETTKTMALGPGCRAEPLHGGGAAMLLNASPTQTGHIPESLSRVWEADLLLQPPGDDQMSLFLDTCDPVDTRDGL